MSTQRLGALGPGEKAVDQRAQVKSRAADNDRKVMAVADFGEHLPGATGIFAGSHRLRRVDDIEQMMRCAGTFFRRRLGGADVEFSIDSDGIAIDDFALKALGQREGKGRLAGTGGTEQDDEQRVAHGAFSSAWRMRMNARTNSAMRITPQSFRRSPWCRSGTAAL